MVKIFRTAALGAWTLVACSSSPPEPATVDAGSDFTLAVGEAASLAGSPLTVTVVDVAEDSRCPAETRCVWEGNAKVMVETVLQGSTRTFALNTTVLPRTGPSAVDVGPYRVSLVRLEPEPRAERIAADEYRAVLRVAAAPDGG